MALNTTLGHLHPQLYLPSTIPPSTPKKHLSPRQLTPRGLGQLLQMAQVAPRTFPDPSIFFLTRVDLGRRLPV
jgi:hypothetical protein